jgi:hypothetical protein
MATPLSLVKFGDQEPSAVFEHAVHLVDCGQLIILGHVVQSQGARDRVECSVGEREVLRVRDLEGRRYFTSARPSSGAFDHLDCSIDAVDRARGCHALSEHDRKAASAAAHIEHPIAGLQLKIISHHGA